jgi:hypothetical protein
MTLSISSVVQYTVFGVFAYILAGAPLLSIFSSDSGVVKTQLSFDQAETLVFPEKVLKCPEHKYAVHILSRDPLVVYIEGFLSHEEAEHVVTMRWVAYFNCPFKSHLLFSLCFSPLYTDVDRDVVNPLSNPPQSGPPASNVLTPRSANPKKRNWKEIVW